MNKLVAPTVIAVASLAAGAAAALPDDDRKAVAALDTEFQAAVKQNDADTIARILHEDMVLVLGNGRVVSREEQIQSARDRDVIYEHQEEDEGTQVVRVFGDTAVVTARLWIQGKSKDGEFDRRLWFTDTYVRTAKGWRYWFGQASLRLPPDAPQ